MPPWRRISGAARTAIRRDRSPASGRKRGTRSTAGANWARSFEGDGGEGALAGAHRGKAGLPSSSASAAAVGARLQERERADDRGHYDSSSVHPELASRRGGQDWNLRMLAFTTSAGLRASTRSGRAGAYGGERRRRLRLDRNRLFAALRPCPDRNAGRHARRKHWRSGCVVCFGLPYGE